LSPIPIQAEASEVPPVASKEHATNKAGQCFEVVENPELSGWFPKHLDYRIDMMTPTGNASVVIVFHKFVQ
jgi:hypothetical protein